LHGAATALATAGGETAAALHAFKAPLLNRILADPGESEERVVVLDLGGPCQTLLDRLRATRPCRVEIADLVSNNELDAINAIDSIEDEGPSRIRQLLPGGNDEPLDLILCWDLPNYLTLKALTLLIDALAPRVAPDCRLHMLIAYSTREMASMPGRYIPTPDGNLTQILTSDELAEAPRYSPEDIGSALADFAYERGVLLSNGMQECVYVWPETRGVDRPY